MDALQERTIDTEAKLFAELDKGIDDLENGRTVPHEEAMKIIKKRVDDYVQNNRIK